MLSGLHQYLFPSQQWKGTTQYYITLNILAGKTHVEPLLGRMVQEDKRKNGLSLISYSFKFVVSWRLLRLVLMYIVLQVRYEMQAACPGWKNESLTQGSHPLFFKSSEHLSIQPRIHSLPRKPALVQKSVSGSASSNGYARTAAP